MFEFTMMVVALIREGRWDELVELRSAIDLEDLLGSTQFQRAQSGGNLSSLVIGITIAAIIVIAVAIPVINDTVAQSNATGTTATILGLLDLFLGLLILVAIAAPLMRRS